MQKPLYFTSAVASYDILPYAIVKPFAIGLILIEGLVSAALLIGLKIKIASFISSLLFIMFGLAISINLLRKRREIDCGCFGGKHHQKISLKLLIRDLILLLCSLLIFIKGGGYLSIDNLPMVSITWLSNAIERNFLPIVLVLISSCMIYLLVNQLFRLLHLIGQEEL